MAEYDDRVAKIVDAALDKFQIELVKSINGTYLRGHEAQLRFGKLEESFARLEKFLTTEDGGGLRAVVRHEVNGALHASRK